MYSSWGVFVVVFLFWWVGGMGAGGLTLETVKLRSHISK